MNFKKAMIVYRKEILEMLRDKRTLFTTIVLPVIMYPLLFMGFSAIMSRQSDVLEKRGATIAFQDSLSMRDAPLLAFRDSVFARLGKMEYVTAVPSPPNVDSLFADKTILGVVTITDSMDATGQPKYRVKVKYDASSEQSRLLYGKIEKTLTSLASEETERRLKERSIDPELIKPMNVQPVDTSTAEKKMGTVLGMILPYLMILTLVAGASTIAADLVSGEKERHTLETLLVSSATRSEIVMGKYLTIITMAMLNVLINLVSLSFSVRFLVAQNGLETQGLQLPVSAFAILLVAMIPLATLFAALLLSVSTFSRNMKEARTYEQPIMMVSMLLGMISFIPSIEINNLLAMIPVVNISLLFKAVMINEYTLSHLLITIGSTLLLDVAAIWVTVRLFNTEAVLFRTEDDGSIKHVRQNKRNFFNSYYGLVYFAIALAGLYYLGGMMQRADMFKGMIQTQLLVILLPVLLILRLLKLPQKQILRLQPPRLKELALVPLIAVSAQVVTVVLTQLVDKVFPFPPEYLERMSGLLQMGDHPMWMMLLVFAVAPGICEEVMFRGFMMRFYEGYGKIAAVLISAFLFAVFHLDPFKLVQVMLLGTLLGYLTIRSGSIYNSMFSHFINNALAIVLVNFESAAWLKPFITAKTAYKYWIVVPAALILAGSLWVFHKVTANREVA